MKLRAHDGPVRTVWWSADGRRFATAGSDGTATVWDALAGKLLQSWKSGGPTIKCLAWSPDGRHVAGTDPTGLIQVWEPAADRRVSVRRCRARRVLRGMHWLGSFGPAPGLGGR